MGHLSDGIGTFFEERLLSAVPQLIDKRANENAPDFQWGKVHLEAKVGYDKPGYGCKPKEYQFKLHARFYPTVYVFGYHDFDDAWSRLAGMSARDVADCMHANARIKRVVFVSASVVHRVSRRETRVDRNGTPYFTSISCNDLIHIMKNNSVRRGEQKVPARDYYGLDGFRYALPEPVGYLLRKRQDNIISRLGDIDLAALQNPR